MYEVAIIGGGPAGASAAIFASKANKKTILFDDEDGLTQHALVKNHYGVEEIEGPDLVDTGKQQAASFGTEVVTANVTEIVRVSEGFRLQTDKGAFEARYVILASGVQTGLAEKAGVHKLPATEPRISERVEVDSDGRTNVEGIWACGIIAGVSPHTIITAGDGAKVAVNLISELNGARYVDHDVYTG